MVWHSLRPIETDILREQLKKFGQRHPEWEFGELYYQPETARTNYIVSALGGSGPALFWGASDNVGPLVELKVIQPIEPHVEKAYLDSFITEPLAANTWFQSHLYQVADRVGNHLCLVYNKALVPEPPRTMRELIEMGKTLTRDVDGDGKADRYALAWNYIEPFFVIPFIGGYGGWIMNDSLQPTLNTEAVVQAAQLIYDLANKHRIIPPECDYETANALFKDGLSAMIINGPWSWGFYTKNNIDIGLTRIPKIDATGLWPTPMVSPLGYSLNVNLKGERLKIAVELLQFLTSPEVELNFTRATATIPSRKEAWRSPVVRNNKLLQESLYQLMVGRPMPVVTEMRWIWDAMRPGYQAIFTGGMTPKQAAEEMQKLALKLIKENRE
ncbi:MAG: extracellular solute-binding protein [candidate division KSB1 bacterium]|nr:extracellular solute-binding protein [candidate division KSB1 bacterium]